MRKLLVFLSILVLILESCNGTFVTKNVIDSRNFNFIHAGKAQTLLFELKEIKTFTRRNGIFTLHRDSGPVDRSTRFDFAIYASVSDGKTMHEIYEFPCQKDIDFDDFPEFSRKFHLVGEDEALIRELFHSKVLKQIESDPNYHIESNGQSIIIFRFDQKMNKESIKQMIRFAKKLILNLS